MRVITKHTFKQAGKGAIGSSPPKRRGLSSRKVNDYLRFSIFLVCIGMAYIWNSYEAERKIKLVEAYRKEAKTLKSHYLLKRATLSAGTRFSQLQEGIDTLGLRALSSPAFKVVKGLDMPLDKWMRLQNPPQFEPIAPEDSTNLPQDSLAPPIEDIALHDHEP